MCYVDAPIFFQNWPQCRGGGGGAAGLSWSGPIGCASVAHRWKAQRTAFHPVQPLGASNNFPNQAVSMSQGVNKNGWPTCTNL